MGLSLRIILFNQVELELFNLKPPYQIESVTILAQEQFPRQAASGLQAIY